MELALRAAMLHLGADLLEKLLDADTGYRGPRIDCGHRHCAEFVSYRDKCLDTALGRITLRRAYYHCRTCKRGVVPRDDELDVNGASLSPGLRRMTARAAAEQPFAKASGLLAELAGVPLSTKRVERSAEADGATAEQRIRTESRAIADGSVPVLPPATLPDKLYVAVDGTGVPMVPAATQGHPGKYPDGRARTREVKLACLFTQRSLDERGRPVRDPGSTSYLSTLAPPASSPPWYTPRPAAAGPTTSANSSCSATGRTGSGTSPPPSCPRPPRSWTSTTPANTYTTSPSCSPPP
ncbi:MAG: hypothetical protein ACRDRL_05040 [Sciscionella sp.]